MVLKKLTVLGLTAFLSGCGMRYTPPPDLPSSVTQISTPLTTQLWLQTVLTYKPDKVLHGKIDFWAPCALTYRLGGGDCEDYAICAATLMEGDVEQGFIITVDNSETRVGHAAFAYQLQGKWGIISNVSSEFRMPEYSTLHQAVFGSMDAKYTHYKYYDYLGVDIVNGVEDLESKFKFSGPFKLR